MRADALPEVTYWPVALSTNESGSPAADVALAFDAEIVLRFGACLPRWRDFFWRGANVLDLVLAVGSSVAVVPAVREGSWGSWLSGFALARFYRVILEIPRMKPLLVRPPSLPPPLRCDAMRTENRARRTFDLLGPIEFAHPVEERTIQVPGGACRLGETVQLRVTGAAHVEVSSDGRAHYEGSIECAPSLGGSQAFPWQCLRKG